MAKGASCISFKSGQLPVADPKRRAAFCSARGGLPLWRFPPFTAASAASSVIFPIPGFANADYAAGTEAKYRQGVLHIDPKKDQNAVSPVRRIALG